MNTPFFPTEPFFGGGLPAVDPTKKGCPHADSP